MSQLKATSRHAEIILMNYGALLFAVRAFFSLVINTHLLHLTDMFCVARSSVCLYFASKFDFSQLGETLFSKN